jgi:hypothetical protein
MSEWIVHTGDENPVPGKKVVYEMMDENRSVSEIEEEVVKSKRLYWGSNIGDASIFSYKVIEENETELKETNPKDAVGVKKVSFSTVPSTVIAEIAVGMTEGARKYARHNWRVAGVRGSIYYDATLRHLFKWWEGEDVDADSGLSHITKAITSLVVLRDAMINDKFTDDRPPKVPVNFWNDIQYKVNEVFEKYPESLPAFVEGDQYDKKIAETTFGNLKDY